MKRTVPTAPIATPGIWSSVQSPPINPATPYREIYRPTRAWMRKCCCFRLFNSLLFVYHPHNSTKVEPSVMCILVYPFTNPFLSLFSSLRGASDYWRPCLAPLAPAWPSAAPSAETRPSRPTTGGSASFSTSSRAPESPSTPTSPSGSSPSTALTSSGRYWET